MFVVVKVCLIFVCFHVVPAVISISAEHTGSYEINANSNDLKLLYKKRSTKRNIPTLENSNK